MTGIKPFRVCISCKQTKAKADFYCYPYTTKQGKRSVRAESRCKDCTKARRRERNARKISVDLDTYKKYRAANKTELARRLKAYRNANIGKVRAQRIESERRRRIAKSGKKMGLVARVLDEYRVGDKYIDAYSCELIDVPTIDHIVPLSCGGKHEYDNLCVTSLGNNSSKRNRPLLLWLLNRAA